MAIWKLLQPHYLNVEQFDEFEPVEYMYQEQDRESGRMRRKTWAVPMYLPAETFVSDQANPHNYIVFKGDPTPDMLPVDAEARKVSAQFEGKWKHAIESLPANGDFSASLIRGFEKQIDALIQSKGDQPVQNTSGKGVDPTEFAAMQKQIEELTKALAAKDGVPKDAATPAPVKTTARRV